MKFSKYEVKQKNGDIKILHTRESLDVSHEHGMVVFKDGETKEFIAAFENGSIYSIVGIDGESEKIPYGHPSQKPFLGAAIERLKKDIESGRIVWGVEGARNLPVHRYGCPHDAPLQYSLMRVMSQ